jgi:hypothetical protein
LCLLWGVQPRVRFLARELTIGSKSRYLGIDSLKKIPPRLLCLYTIGGAAVVVVVVVVVDGAGAGAGAGVVSRVVAGLST